MTLHPQARRAIEHAEAEGGPGVTDPGFDIAAKRTADREAAAGQVKAPVAEMRDVDAGGVPARLYLPEGYDCVVVHAHGGGFVFNDVEVHDAAVRRFARMAGAAVLSVDYRRPPKHRFPAAPDDVTAAADWVAADPGLGALPAFVHGDSAGGNLALVTALRRPGRFAGVVLIYPFLDPTRGFDSYRTAADGFDESEAAWYWEQYAGSADDLTDPDLAPLLSDHLGTLPPTLITTAEHDPLRDEGEHLALLLAEAGVQVVATRYVGQIHGYWRHPAVFDAASATMAQVAGWIRMRLAT